MEGGKSEVIMLQHHARSLHLLLPRIERERERKKKIEREECEGDEMKHCSASQEQCLTWKKR